MEQNISLVQARALEQVEIDSAADDDYADMQDVEDVSYLNVEYKISFAIFTPNKFRFFLKNCLNNIL